MIVWYLLDGPGPRSIDIALKMNNLKMYKTSTHIFAKIISSSGDISISVNNNLIDY
jgi:hypothetical protein